MKRVLLLLASQVIPFSAHAMVAPANGNYFVGFTDLEHETPPNTVQLRIQRTYNSRSQFDGIFGYGWGSDNEGYLLPAGDGSVVIQENGGGDKTRFAPAEFSKADLGKHVDRLVEAYMKKQKGSGIRPADIREKLMKSANERDEMSRNLGVFPQLAEGTKLFSTQRGDKQVILVHKLGYVREFADGKRELFSFKADVTDQGIDPQKRRVLKGVLKVSRVSDPVHKSELFFEYDAKGRLITTTDKKAQTIRFRYNDAGKVVEVTDKNGNKASYEYCPSTSYNDSKKCGPGDLVKSRDTANHSYTYQYDSVHNLIRVGSPKSDGKPGEQEFEEVAYWPATGSGQGGVKSVKLPTGVKVEYSYWQDPTERDTHYKTETKTTFTSGKSTAVSYEWFEKARADGSRYRYKLISVTDGDKVETIYNECCGQPLQISSASGNTKFEYYPGTGLPKEKDSPTENVQWEYHPKFHGKITKVIITSKADKTVRSSEYEYDKDKGQLTKARTSGGKGIVLGYDSAGRISTMVDQLKRRIKFVYSNKTKPTEIVEEGVGSIKVTYDKDGQIKDVKSTGGRKIAISVADAFQNLLEIIKPAGIQPI